MKQNTTFAAAFLIFLAISSADAHDTWLLPNHSETVPKTEVTLDLTSGMAFPELETGPKRARIQAANCRLAGETFDIKEISEDPQSLRFETEVPAAGVAAFWVKFPPKEIEIKPEQVHEYLEEIGGSAALRKEWSEMKPPRCRELYSKHQKTFIRVGTATADDQSLKEAFGVALEIAPEQDPTTLKTGGGFSVRVLKDGKPFPVFPLNAIAGGETKGETRKTDAEGRVSLPLEKFGPWLLRGTEVRKSSKLDADWESDFTTLTINVLEKE